MRTSSAVPSVLVAVFVFAGCIETNEAPAALDTHEIQVRLAVCEDKLKGIDLQFATIEDLRAAMAAGKLTSLELVEAYIARIDAFDEAGPRLNSVRMVNPNARADAAALDAERAAGTIRGPLHGIPVMLKDNVGTVDMPTTAGAVALENNIPIQDATIVERFRAAGAVILGKLELSEFAGWAVFGAGPAGWSSLGGQVKNAYTGGSPSGSSSGSGVAGSMAFGQITIGTETSGSILGPSNSNSLAAVKPSHGLVSGAGIIPLAQYFDVAGPMGRHVYDSAVVLSVIAGPDPRDDFTKAAPTGIDYTKNLSTTALAGVRIGFVDSNNSIFLEALGDLAAQGAILVEVDVPDEASLSTAEIALIPNEFHHELETYLAEETAPDFPIKTFEDLTLFNAQHADRYRDADGDPMIQTGLIASQASLGIAPITDAGAPVIIERMAAVANSMFEDNDVEAIVRSGSGFSGLGAAAGFPTVIVPAGYNDTRPQGLSFFGPKFSEERLLAFAYDYEQATMNRLPPTVVNATLYEGVCDIRKPGSDKGKEGGGPTGTGGARFEDELSAV